jgi:outer membrane protein assembly factor BamB
MVGEMRFFVKWVFLLIAFVAGSAFSDDWPQWRGPDRDGVWREDGIVEAFTGNEIELRWRVPVSSGYSGPAVADGRVYLTDRLTKPKQVERVLCFDWRTGKELWSYDYDCEYRNVSYSAGPRATMIIHDGLAYALGSMGHLHCFDAVTGEVRWRKDLNSEYGIEMPMWGISSSQLIEGDLLITQVGGTPDACLVAFDRRTGGEKWRALEDRASYSAPIVIDQAGKRVLACWTGDNIVGLDAQSGEVYWTHAYPPAQMVLSVASPVFDRDRLFFTGFYEGSLLLGVDPNQLAVKKIWRRLGESEKQTDGLQSIISTPLFIDDHIYGVDSYGELRCLESGSGERIWEDLTAVPRARWGTIHFVRNGDTVWMFNERGELLITSLSPAGLKVLSRAQLIEPTFGQLNERGGVCWAHPAFAYKHIFARNDEALVCASLERPGEE